MQVSITAGITAITVIMITGILRILPGTPDFIRLFTHPLPIRPSSTDTVVIMGIAPFIME